MLAIYRVEVRRRVIVIIHSDDDSEEDAECRHENWSHFTKSVTTELSCSRMVQLWETKKARRRKQCEQAGPH
jgi:hypothetical protein